MIFFPLHDTDFILNGILLRVTQVLKLAVENISAFDYAKDIKDDTRLVCK